MTLTPNPIIEEVLEPRLTERPSCFPDKWEEPVQSQYWCCSGKLKRRKKFQIFNKRTWVTLHSSQYEAELHAAIHSDECWTWDGRDAFPVNIKDAMFEAKSFWAKGVKILGFRGGNWVTVREFPINKPLSSI